MLTRSLAQIRGRVRVETSFEGSNEFIDDTDLNDMIIESLESLIDDVADQPNAFAYFGSSVTLTGTSPLALPADFYQLWGLYRPDRDSDRLEPLNFHNRQYVEEVEGTLTFTLEYLRSFDRTSFDADSETFTGPPGWDRFVIHDVAAQILNISEQENARSRDRRDAAQQRIVQLCSNVDRYRVVNIGSGLDWTDGATSLDFARVVAYVEDYRYRLEADNTVRIFSGTVGT